jgi:signal transduction histidine kinase
MEGASVAELAESGYSLPGRSSTRPDPAESERSEAWSADARIAELALDLHDGPLQDLAAVSCFVARLRDELATVVAADDGRERLLSLVDAVERGLASLDGDLRHVAWSMRSPATSDEPLDDALRAELEQLEQDTGIETLLDVRAAVDGLPAAGRTTLLQVAREALANVAKHSGSTEVRVVLEGSEELVRLEIVDDGRGFDVESGLADAAREGRLGVVGMAERVRLVGGSFEIQSRPGGPTRVAAVMAASEDAGRWPPGRGDGSG